MIEDVKEKVDLPLKRHHKYLQRITSRTIVPCPLTTRYLVPVSTQRDGMSFHLQLQPFGICQRKVEGRNIYGLDVF